MRTWLTNSQNLGWWGDFNWVHSWGSILRECSVYTQQLTIIKLSNFNRGSWQLSPAFFNIDIFMPSKQGCLISGCINRGTIADFLFEIKVKVTCVVIFSCLPPFWASLPYIFLKVSLAQVKTFPCFCRCLPMSCRTKQAITVVWDVVSTKVLTCTSSTCGIKVGEGPTVPVVESPAVVSSTRTPFVTGLSK